MNDRHLYQQILGITAPWAVAAVDLDLSVGEIRVTIAEATTALCCPECDQPCPRYDRQERRWRHLDTCQYRTILIAAVPRVACPTHGVHRIRVPWAEDRSRFTALFEALVIDWLQHTENIAAVAAGMRLSWDQVAGIRSRAVARGLARRGPAALPAAVGIDETSITRRHQYITVVSALGTGQVLEVLDDRTTATLEGFWSRYAPDALAGLEAIAMDMWAPYIAATRFHVPEADTKIVFDKFHILQHLGNAVDRVRREEHRALRAAGDDRLTKTRYLWLTRLDRLAGERRQQLTALAASALRTARAFRYKEHAAHLWGYVRYGAADRAWRHWLQGALRCRLEPIRAVARMIRAHLPGVLNAATSDITNAMAETINSHIQRIKKRACGFRSRPRYREAILFHLGGLDLYPTLSASTHTNS